MESRVRFSDGADLPTDVLARDVFVTFDPSRDVAHIAYERDGRLRWLDLDRPVAELLIALGARGHVELA